jgi:ABC-2 type transport system ATP-binding protein
MSGLPVVEVREPCKSYGGRLVVDHIDVDVHTNEIVGLLGANGAGKTTTVECIEGLRRPDSGWIRVLGLDPAKDGDRLRSLIGSQMQDSARPDRLRVDEAIELFRARGRSRSTGCSALSDCPATAGSRSRR